MKKSFGNAGFYVVRQPPFSGLRNAVVWIFLCFSVGQRVVNAFIFDEKPGLNLVRTLNREL